LADGKYQLTFNEIHVAESEKLDELLLKLSLFISCIRRGYMTASVSATF